MTAATQNAATHDVATQGATTDAAPARRARGGFLRERGMGASILVAALSSAFGAILVGATGYIAALLQADPYIGDSGTLAVVIAILTVLLTAVAIYVAAIVTANTFSTIVAGRTRRIALLRLIGATARSQRAQVARQGLAVGGIGAAAGVATAAVLTTAGVVAGNAALGVEGLGYQPVQPAIALPAAIVVLTTWAAAWIGSRRVLDVTPLQALGGSVDRAAGDVSRPRRNVAAIVLFSIGIALLVLGILAGLFIPLGVIVAFFGGLFSFTGLVLGATSFMPPVLRLVGRVFGRSATARLAAENALRYPERSSRMAIGVVVGVTLVTMFAVATESAKAVYAASLEGASPQVVDELFTVMDTFTYVMMGLVAVASVIAAVGLVNLLTIGVVQRRRELGLLRALGFSARQVRRTVLIEAAHIVIASLGLGLVLGVFYGWAGAQSLLGSIRPTELTGVSGPSFVWPAVPLWLVVIVVAATALLTLVAAATPTRLATRVTPVEALAVD